MTSLGCCTRILPQILYLVPSALMCVAVAVLCAALVWDYGTADAHLWGLAVYSGCRMDCSAAVRVVHTRQATGSFTNNQHNEKENNMNIEELLTKHTDLTHKRDEVFENQIYSLVYNNEVPIELKDNDGNPTGFTITTPDDLWKASPAVSNGCAALISGSVVMVAQWMFVNILHNLDHTHLVHKGY